MRYAIWYRLYNLKNVKNTHRRVLQVTLLHGCTKSRNPSHMSKAADTSAIFADNHQWQTEENDSRTQTKPH